MRAIVRSAALAVIVTAMAHADAHDDVIQAITKMAAALTGETQDGDASRSGNVPEFMSAFSKEFPEYDTLKQMVTALVNSAEVSSSIEPQTEEPGKQTYKIDLDWVLQIRSLVQDGPMVRRREVVHCELRKENKHWKIVSLKPLGFFAPANLGQ